MAEDAQPKLTDFSGSDDADGADDAVEGHAPEAEIAEAVAGNGDSGATVVDMSDRRYPDAEGTTTLAVTQVDYTVEGRGDDERPVLHVFGRDPDREPVHVRVHEFDPYFYAPLENFVTDEAKAGNEPDEWTEEDLDPGEDPVRQHDRLTGRFLTDADGEPFESIRGDRLLKVTGQTPRDVGQIRDRFDHYEADILFPNRLLIDRDIRSGVRVPVRRDDEDGPIDVHHAELEPVEVDVAPRVCTFDIEVDDRRGFPEDGEEPIVCLTSHDSYDDQYIVWLYTAPDGIEGPDDLSGYEPIEDDLDVDVRAFEREEVMLSSFIDYIRERDPDVLTGWNFTDFDAPYLLDRIEELASPENGLSVDPTSRVNEVWRSDWQGPNVKGRVVFDLLYAYKRTQFTELDSYRLDAVGETELDVGKERYTGDIGDLWEQDPERLLEYNLRDVELCVELDRKQEIVPFWQEVASFVGCKLEDATTPGDAVDMYILHEVHGDFVLPSKGTVDAEDYEGGAVFDPITGVKENVSVLDLASLYPMSMVTINASPETKVGDDYDGPTYHAPNGTKFRKEPDGIIRTMVDDLLAEREEKKSLRNEFSPKEKEYEQYDRQQAAVKVIMNSLYGVLGWDRFRLYDKEMGSAVTATGREVIRYTEEVVSGMNYQIVYGDTDSVMLELGGDVTKEEAVEKSFDIEERVNESYDEFAEDRLGAEEHRFEIEFEKLYRRFFQAGKKKRYAGLKVWVR
jgi:DNA polymerase I